MIYYSVKHYIDTFATTVIYIVLFIIVSFSLLSFAGHEVSDKSVTEKEPLQIVVSILPLKYIVESIGGDRVSVYSLVNEREFAEIYNMSAKELFQLEKSDMYISLGGTKYSHNGSSSDKDDTRVYFPFEQEAQKKIIERASTVVMLPIALDVELVSFSDTVMDLDEYSTTKIESNKYNYVYEGDEHKHEHNAYDIHVWLDTDIISHMAKKIYIGLSQYVPQHASFFEKNYQKLQEKIKKTAQELELLHNLEKKVVFIVHPVLGYLARKFSFTQISLEWLGKERGMRDIIALETIIQDYNIRTLFTQPTRNIYSAKKLIETYSFATVDIVPLKEDILQNLVDISKALLDRENK